MSKRNGNEKYFYEIRLPEKLMGRVKCFAEERNAELNLCIEEVLKEGLKVCEAVYENNAQQLYLDLRFWSNWLGGE